MIGDAFEVRTSKALRRLFPGQVMEVLLGPKKDKDGDVMRLQGRFLDDGKVGWVTVTGNQGTVHLKEVCSEPECAKDTMGAVEVPHLPIKGNTDMTI